MGRFESVLEGIDSTFILIEEQRNVIKAFVDRKDVFAVLPTRFGKSLIYQLALVTYYVGLIGCRSIQLSGGIFFPGSVETRPIITAQWSGITHILTRIMSMTSSGYKFTCPGGKCRGGL